MIVVTIQDVRAARLCTGGTRRWFANRGLDFKAFLRDGLDAEVLRALGDPLADQAIAAAEARHG